MKLTNSIIDTFDFEGRTVRTIMKLGEPWFVAADVCAILELTNVSKKVSETLDEDEKDITISDTLGGPQQMLIVNESGLYALIFQSRKGGARGFRKWVTAVVLPALRKNKFFDLERDSAHELADWEMCRSRARLRVLRLLTELERNPEPGVEYLTVSEFLLRQGCSLDKNERLSLVKAVQTVCRSLGKHPIRQFRSNSLIPTTLWPTHCLQEASKVLPPPPPQLNLS